jgi:tetratricopeptide (TPR) repeat protein
MDRAKNLRLARQHMGMTLEQACEGICSPSLLSLIERGKRPPSAALLTKLEERLHVGIESTSSSAVSDEYLAALAFVRAGRFDEALKIVIHDSNETRLIQGMVFMETNRLDEAREAFEELLHSETLKPILIGPAAQCVVTIERDAGDFYSAIYWGEDALERLAARHLDETSEAYVLRATLSTVYLEVGDTAKAYRLVNSHRGNLRSIRDKAVSLWAGGAALHAQGEVGEAAVMLRAAAELTAKLDQDASSYAALSVAIWLEALAETLDFSTVYLELDAAENFTRQSGVTKDLATVLNTRALVLQRAGRFDEAREQIALSIEIGKDLPGYLRAALLVEDGEIYIALGDSEEAAKVLHEAKSLLLAQKAKRHLASSWAKIASCYELQGDFESAYLCFKMATEAAGLGQNASAAVSGSSN